jgi:DNA-binding transcriptional regulator YhcF (GntR family)
MVTIGIGPDDPRAWVRAGYLLLSEMESGQAGPQGKLSSRSQVAAKLGVHRTSVTRAYRELTDLGIIYLVPGLGYFPSAKSGR